MTPATIWTTPWKICSSKPRCLARRENVQRGRRDPLLTAGDKRLGIARAAADLPFRWMVSEGERTRGVTSIAGLLRAVRAAVDPGYRPIRLRIAPLPLLPP